MKHVLIRSGLFLAAIVTACSVATGASGSVAAANLVSDVPTSTIQFNSTVHDFGLALAGEPVRHVFTFRNSGSVDLVVGDVQPGCGCTKLGEWTHRAKPGETGIIPLQLNTAGLNGVVDREVKVIVKEPAPQTISLKLKGTVRRAFEMTPSVAVLNLQPDAPFATATIRITNCLELPLFLGQPQSTNSTLGAALTTNLCGWEYLLNVSNTLPLPPGAVAAAITVNTSLTNLPVIHLLTLAISIPPLTVDPGQISLASPPLATNQVAHLTILNNSTNPVTLYDPCVNLSGVTVSLEETKPGASFAAVLSFPAGFTLPSGQSNVFSVRSSHPSCPLVQVPILQVSNPVPTAPLLSKTKPELGTAPMPMVFQSKAVGSLKLSQEELEGIDGLKKEFVEAIGGLSEDPGDPAYLARWQQARSKSDAQLSGVIGRRAMVRFDVTAPADSGSQP